MKMQFPCAFSRWQGLPLLRVLALFSTFLLTPLAAQAQVRYLDATGAAQSAPGPIADITDCSKTTLTAGWYRVSGTLTCHTTITIHGSVNLILADGSSLTVTGAANNAGISVGVGNSLTVYAQSTGSRMGVLTAIGGRGYGGAGIGGGMVPSTAGAIIINGGTINATGGGTYRNAGIGGGCMDGNGGAITINGGTVNATCRSAHGCAPWKPCTVSQASGRR
jgi:hypothetical protein